MRIEAEGAGPGAEAPRPVLPGGPARIVFGGLGLRRTGRERARRLAAVLAAYREAAALGERPNQLEARRAAGVPPRFDFSPLVRAGLLARIDGLRLDGLRGHGAHYGITRDGRAALDAVEDLVRRIRPEGAAS